MKEVRAENWIHNLGLDELSVFSSCTTSQGAEGKAVQGATGTSPNGLKRKQEDLDPSQRKSRHVQYQVQGNNPDEIAIQGILHLDGTKAGRAADPSLQHLPQSPEAQDEEQVMHEYQDYSQEFPAAASSQLESHPSPGPRSTVFP